MQPAFGEPTGLLVSALVDCHTHIDKSFVVDQTGAADGDLFRAIDRMRHHLQESTSDEIEGRMQKALEMSYACGTRALRTHLDWSPQSIDEASSYVPRSLAVFEAKRTEWADKIELQAVSLTPLDMLVLPQVGEHIAACVKAAGGVLGAFVYRNTELTQKLKRVFELASAFDLDLDFHVDEGLDADAVGVFAIASIKSVAQFQGQVVVSHACSLSVQDDQQAIDTLLACKEAGLQLVSLPLTNLYLQGDWQGTPVERGITRIKEASVLGLPVSIANDNVQDAFFPYGDYDLASCFATAVLGAHLSPIQDYIRCITVNPASLMQLSWNGIIELGCPADFVLFNARSANGLMTDAGRSRRVFRAGVEI